MQDIDLIHHRLLHCSLGSRSNPAHHRGEEKLFVTYWLDKATQGIAIVFGPVMDPNGVYGIGIYQVTDEAEMRALLQADPANGLLHYDLLPMARAVVGTVSKQ